MLSYQVYKVLHFIGIFMVVSALGGQLLNAMNKGERQHSSKRWLAIWHGVGLVIALVAGFGLLARLQIPFSGWLWGKLGIWLAFGALGAIAARKQDAAKLLWILTIVLGGLGAYLAGYKPF